MKTTGVQAPARRASTASQKPLRLMTAQSGVSTTQVDDAGGVAGGSDGASSSHTYRAAIGGLKSDQLCHGGAEGVSLEDCQTLSLYIRQSSVQTICHGDKWFV